MIKIKKCNFVRKLILSYPAQHFIENDQAILKALIKNYPLAQVICCNNSEITTSYLPLLWKNKDELVGHLDLNNPQVKLLQEGKKVNVVFNGPQGYISPSHFTSNELPTFNYCKIEVEGIIFPISNERLKNEIISLTQLLEGEETAYQLTLDEKRLHSLVNYIFGFKIKISSIQGRFKMSQDKSSAHQKKAVKLVLASEKRSSLDFFELYTKLKL